MPARSGSSSPSARGPRDSFSRLRSSRRSCLARCFSFRASSFCRLFERVCTSQPPQRRSPTWGQAGLHPTATARLSGDGLDVCRLQSLGPLLGLELHLLSLGEAAEAVGDDGSVMAEDVGSPVV